MAKKDKPRYNIKHYQISRSNEIEDIIGSIREEYGVQNLVPQGGPLKLGGNHKILTLKFLNRPDILIRISGPDFIIDDVFTVWFAKYFH